MHTYEDNEPPAYDWSLGTEVTVAGVSTIHWNLDASRLSYLRAKHYPRAVHTADIVDLADLVGPAYPGTFGLAR